MKNLSARLKELRWDMKLTQKQLADATGIGYSTIQAYEQGSITPSDQAMHRLTKFFNVSDDYLLGNDDNKTAADSNDHLIEVISEHNPDVTGMQLDQALQIVDKLEKLVKLLHDGAITEEEYRTIKSKIIGK